MSQIWLYKLKPRAPFHFGERGVGIEATEDVLHSDSLFSAIAIGICMWDGERVLRELLPRFTDPAGPPFRLSSLFPYAGAAVLFPRPMLRVEGVPVDKAKQLKDIRFVSQRIFHSILDNKPIGESFNADNFIQGGTVWVHPEDLQLLPEACRRTASIADALVWERQRVPRVTVDRVTASSQVYQSGRILFEPDCGLCFLLETFDPDVKRYIEGALYYLSEAGLGGERNVGHGQFEPLPAASFDPPWALSGDAFVTLSYYHPTKTELETGIMGDASSYDLTQRRGWISTPERGGQRRKSIFCFTEGSVLCSLGKVHYGDMANVTPELPGDQPVFRYGFAFPVPFSLRMKGDGE